MFYNHELLKRSGRFGVLWLAATKPKVLTELEYRQCDLRALCQEILEYFNHRARKEQGKPLFSLRTCTTLFVGATDVYIQQTRLLARDCRRFRERVSRVVLGYDSDGNAIQAVPDPGPLMGPPLPPESGAGKKTPRRGKGVKAGRGDEDDDEEENDEGRRGKKRKKDKKEEDEPKKKRKVKTTLPTGAQEDNLQGWDLLLSDNILQGIPESDESEFFFPNSSNVVDSSRITMPEYIAHPPPSQEADDEAGFEVEKMLSDEIDMVVEPPMPQDLDLEGEAPFAAELDRETAPIAPPEEFDPTARAMAEPASPSRETGYHPVVEPVDQPVVEPVDQPSPPSSALPATSTPATNARTSPVISTHVPELADAPVPDTAPLPLFDEGEEIAAGNVLGVSSRISMMRDTTTPHPALHSTRVDFSDLHMTTAEMDTSQVDRQDLPNEQLMRGIPEGDRSQDFFDPEEEKDDALRAAEEAPLPENCIRSHDALPSTSIADLVDDGHLSVHVASTVRSRAADGAAGSPDTSIAPPPQRDNESAAGGVGVGVGPGADVAPAPELAPAPDAAAVPDVSLPFEAGPAVAPPPDPAAPDPFPDAVAGPSSAGVGAAPPPAENVILPPPRKRPRRRVKPPFLDKDTSISNSDLKRHVRDEQVKETMEDLPPEAREHLMRQTRSELDVKSLFGGAGIFKNLGRTLKPLYQENLVTKHREDGEEEREEEGGEGVVDPSLRGELEREVDRSSMFDAGNGSSFGRKSRDGIVVVGDRSRRGDKTIDRSQGLLGVSTVEASGVRQPVVPEDQITLTNPRRPSLPVVEEELAAGATAAVGEAVDVESVATAATVDSGDTTTTTTSNVPTVTVTEPSPPDEVPPGGGAPGCVKFPELPKDKSNSEKVKEADSAKEVDAVEEVADGQRNLDPIAEVSHEVVTPPRRSSKITIDPAPAVDYLPEDGAHVIASQIPLEEVVPEPRVEFWPQEQIPSPQPPPPPIPAEGGNPPSPIPAEGGNPPSPPAAVVLPHYRRIPSLQQLCPPGECSRKIAIKVFNGILRASMKLLVFAVQDGSVFGGEIELYCRGDNLEHGSGCFCNDKADDADHIKRRFYECLETSEAP